MGVAVEDNRGHVHRHVGHIAMASIVDVPAEDDFEIVTKQMSVACDEISCQPDESSWTPQPTVHDRQEDIFPVPTTVVFPLNLLGSPADVATLPRYLSRNIRRVDCVLYVLEPMSEGGLEFRGD